MLTLVLSLAAAQVLIKQEGVTQGWARTINCSGTGVTCSVDTPTRVATIDVTGGSSLLPDGGVPPAGAPKDGGYLTLTAGSTGSSNERVLTAGTNISITPGAGIATVAVTGAVPTATALAADPTDCGANQYATTIAASGNLTCAQVAYSQLTGAPTIPTDISGASYITKVAEANLSGELALGSLATGVLVNTTTTGIPTIKAANTCTNQFPRSDTASGAWTCASVANADLASSYSGVGTCTNQFARVLNTNAAPTCAGIGVADFTANQGATTTLLHGNGAGQPSWAGVSLTADATANQGTTTTLLHGNGAGQPAFGNVTTSDFGANVLAIANGGTNATATPTNGGVTYGTGTAQAYSAAGTSGQILTSTGAGAPGWKSSAQLIRVSGSNFTTTSATAVNITGLSITTAAATPYMFQCVLDTTGTATGGPRATVTVTTSTVTSIAYAITQHTTSATTQNYTGGSASGTLSTTCTASCLTTDIPIVIEGMVNVNANVGTITIGAANGTAGQTTTVKIGSYCIWWTP